MLKAKNHRGGNLKSSILFFKIKSIAIIYKIKELLENTNTIPFDDNIFTMEYEVFYKSEADILKY